MAVQFFPPALSPSTWNASSKASRALATASLLDRTDASLKRSAKNRSIWFFLISRIAVSFLNASSRSVFTVSTSTPMSPWRSSKKLVICPFLMSRTETS